MEESTQHGEPENFEVEGDGPVLNVIQVVLNPLLDRCVTAPTVDLGPTGHAGLYLVPEHVLWNALLELFHKEGAFRPRTYQRHVALEDVPELG